MKIIHALLIALIGIFSPTTPILSTIVVLVLVDLLTGIIVSRRTGIPITSDGLKRSVLKLLVYMIAVLSAFLVGNFLIGPLVPVLNIVAGLIGVTELKSVLENLDLISGGSLMKSIISAIQKNVSSNIPPQD